MASSEPRPHQVPPPVALHRLMTGHWIAQAIFVAAQFGVADYLRDGPAAHGRLSAVRRRPS
jgi:hypothetical protein